MAKETVETKQFTFNIAASSEAGTELIQLITLAIQPYDNQLTQLTQHTQHAHPCDIPSVIRYFASLYGVKL